MTKYIAVSNRRGGVGKTTITMMLAYGLAVTGRQRVLLIDLDAQASTSMVMMGHKRWREAREANRTNAGLLTQLVGDDKIVTSEYIAKGIGDVTLPGGGAPSLDIMPSSHDLDDREALLMIAHQARFHKISDAFDHMQSRMGQIIRSVDGQYDQVIIDCAPGLSQLVWGALRTADLVLVPYIPDRTAEDNVGWLARRLKENRRHGVLHGAQSRVRPGQPRAGHHRRGERQVLAVRRAGAGHAAARHRARLPRPAGHVRLQVRHGGAVRECADRHRAQDHQQADRGGCPMTDVPAREVLDRLFRAIVREAENNDAFARSLLDALQANLAARAGKKAPARKPFDASQLHAINVLRTHGENVLRGKLEQVKAVEDLRAVARFSGLLLTGPAARPKAKRGDLIEGIIAAAKHYDAQRSTASA